jgi:aspartyl aminopeptidase
MTAHGETTERIAMSELVASLIAYLDASPTPYHAAAESARLLREAGFVPLEEHKPWAIEPGLRAYVIRGGTSLIAFTCGEKTPAEAGFLAVGAHTDSPNLRIKPTPDLNRYGYRQLGVEVYGGVLLSTWLDRDLSIAGRVSVSDGRGGLHNRIVDLARPLVRIPNLAIHLNRNVNSDGLVLNAQSHLAPVLGLMSEEPESLRELIATELAARGDPGRAEDIAGWDLGLYDVQGATVSGASSEFIHSARLDNLASCFAATRALARATDEHPATRLIALYDHEEVGSRSAQGAQSPFLRQVLERLSATAGGVEHFARAIAQSFLISADMAHAIHPNYADRHEPNHAPVLGGGPVLKTNVNQSYATDGEGAARFAALCRSVEAPMQHYVVRSDLPCGSTIGPISASQLGLRTVDIGNPMLSMHSIREMACGVDAEHLARVLDAFFG